jgi:hypothetical protein
MSDIFISYTRKDQPAARKLADALERKGWSVWWDPKLRAGEHFDDVIEQALTESRCIIVLWSKRSVQSRYVKDEAAYALKYKKLVPISIDGVELPFRYVGIHTPRLFEYDGSDTFPGFQSLVADIKHVLGPSPAEEKAKRRAKEDAERRPDAKDERQQEEQRQAEKEAEPKVEEDRQQPTTQRQRMKWFPLVVALIGVSVVIMLVLVFFLKPPGIRDSLCESGDPPFECKFNQ